MPTQMRLQRHELMRNAPNGNREVSKRPAQSGHMNVLPDGLRGRSKPRHDTDGTEAEPC